MIEIIGVRFRTAGKIYYFAPNGITASFGQRVLVETVRGPELGTVVLSNREVEEEGLQELAPVQRIATEDDLRHEEENERRAKDAMIVCKEQIEHHKLGMKLVDAEYTFDNMKLIFYFVADGRVDFRDLVKDLAALFRTRIELRQIGARDQTKMVAGLGLCGRKVCCASFLSEFDQITLKLAKDQGFQTSPQKASGPCGKLMCCLMYEQKGYEQAYEELPKLGDYIDTPDGKGTVCEVQAIRMAVRVRLEDHPDDPPQVYSLYRLQHPDEPVKTEKPVRLQAETDAFGFETAESEPEHEAAPKKKRHRGNRHRSKKPKEPQPS